MQRVIFSALLASALLASATLDAQVEMRIEQNSLTSEELTVDLIIETNEGPISDWGFVICHDDGVLSPDQVTEGSLFEGLAMPAYDSHEFFDGGVAIWTELNFFLGDRLDAGTYESHHVVYSIEDSAASETSITFCANESGTPVGSSIAVIGENEEVTPNTVDATITLVPEGAMFVRGDSTGNAKINIGDAIEILGYMFLDGTLGCEDAADADDSGDISINDPIFLLRYLFANGDSMPAPFQACGVDPSADTLTCADGGACD